MYPLKESSSDCKFSIIIPVLNETDNINSLIEHLHDLRAGKNCEIIVVDGDPKGGTINVIHDKEVRSIVSTLGRAQQMNAGAAIANGEILIFLHADTQLPVEALQKIGSAMERKEYVGGAFNLGIKSESLIFRIIGYLGSLRSRLTRIPYGDQAIFIRKDYFLRIGGYKEIPLMEDLELMHRIKKLGGKICILSDPVNTSPRRWEKEGIIYCTLRYWIILVLYFIGVSPYRLSKFYKSGNEVYKS